MSLLLSQWLNDMPETATHATATAVIANVIVLDTVSE